MLTTCPCETSVPDNRSVPVGGKVITRMLAKAVPSISE